VGLLKIAGITYRGGPTGKSWNNVLRWAHWKELEEGTEVGLLQRAGLNAVKTEERDREA